MTLAERFFSKVEKIPGGCWIFRPAVERDDYGKFRVGEKIERAHRVSWRLAGKRLRRKKPLLHSCDYKPCVCPDHLRPGTDSENLKEAWARGLRS